MPMDCRRRPLLTWYSMARTADFLKMQPFTRSLSIRTHPIVSPRNKPWLWLKLVLNPEPRGWMSSFFIVHCLLLEQLRQGWGLGLESRDMNIADVCVGILIFIIINFVQFVYEIFSHLHLIRKTKYFWKICMFFKSSNFCQEFCILSIHNESQYRKCCHDGSISLGTPLYCYFVFCFVIVWWSWIVNGNSPIFVMYKNNF